MTLKGRTELSRSQRGVSVLYLFMGPFISVLPVSGSPSQVPHSGGSLNISNELELSPEITSFVMS